jgi:ABC-type multidrug transport system fused ATPase/permease subunit
LYAFISLDRIDKFLNGEEELEIVDGNLNVYDGPEPAPGYKNATLSWCAPGAEDDNNFRLSDLNVECAKGELTVIAGPVGSGKSSFLLGLLGEMRLLKGEICLPRTNAISFAAQSPWLQCDSVRQNILFGSEMNQSRYNQVVDACGLSADFEKLQDGDETEIGERGRFVKWILIAILNTMALGVTLSGGQKARIALARVWVFRYQKSDDLWLIIMTGHLFSCTDNLT